MNTVRIANAVQNADSAAYRLLIELKRVPQDERATHADAINEVCALLQQCVGLCYVSPKVEYNRADR